ncbi:unnamed protein product, partial [Ascophyllum nodosum]
VAREIAFLNISWRERVATRGCFGACPGSSATFVARSSDETFSASPLKTRPSREAAASFDLLSNSWS